MKFFKRQTFRHFLVLLPFCIALQLSQAQVMTGASFTGGISVGNLAQYGSGGVGVAVQGKFFVVERLSLGFNAGLQYFFGKTYNFSFIPIRGSVEYYFTDEGARFRPYVGTDLGMYISSYTGTARIKFGVAPGGGIQFELSDAINLGVGLKYNVLTEKNPAMYFEPSINLLYVFGMY